jgi:CRP-like cAMP-binding protein
LAHLHLAHADHNVQALTQVEVASVDRRALRRLVQTNERIASAVFIINQTEASIGREWVLNVGRRTARKRLAHFLCELAVRLEHKGLARQFDYELPMTQEQLADVTGLTSVHVNRTLSAMTQDGLICRKNRQLQFPDLKRLRAKAGFSEAYLHLGQKATAV